MALPDPQQEERRRRNVRLAIIHGLVALGFLVAFVWVQALR